MRGSRGAGAGGEADAARVVAPLAGAQVEVQAWGFRRGSARPRRARQLGLRVEGAEVGHVVQGAGTCRGGGVAGDLYAESSSLLKQIPQLPKQLQQLLNLLQPLPKLLPQLLKLLQQLSLLSVVVVASLSLRCCGVVIAAAVVVGATSNCQPRTPPPQQATAPPPSSLPPPPPPGTPPPPAPEYGYRKRDS